ncbi:hypothetical protein DB354_13650 [Opitutus sp. ER46]|nr:hypothetical protein DB354_13650 [Opitutus sp. ER46]
MTWGAGSLQAATWLKLQTDEVVIYSDASPKDIVEFSVGYSAFQHAFVSLFRPQPGAPRTRVILFRRTSALEEFLPKSDKPDTETVSFTTEVDGVPLVVLAVGSDRAAALERTFEFQTIWGLARAGYALPIWMSQGAGEVLASLQVRKTGYELGEGPAGLAQRWQSSQGLEWKDFFNIHTDSPEYAGWKASGEFHVQAWALMHRVLLAEGEGRARFEALARKLRTLPAADAVESVLGVGLDQLSADIDRHLRRDKERIEVAFDTATPRKERKPEPAPELEVHLAFADLLLATNKRPLAREYLAKAEALAPSSAPVKEALAREALISENVELATTLYREAIAAGSLNPEAFLFSARRRVDESGLGNVDRAGEGGHDIEVAAAELRRAIALHPTSGEAYRLLGRVLYLLPKIGPEHVEELGRGAGLPDAGATVRYYRAMLYSRLGQRASYLAELRSVLNDPSLSRTAKAQVQERLTAGEINATRALLNPLMTARRFADATELLQQRLAEKPEPEVAQEYARMAELVETAAVRSEAMDLAKANRFKEARQRLQQRLQVLKDSRSVDELNRALEIVQERESADAIRRTFAANDWPGCIAAAEKFLKEYPKSGIAPNARKLLESARRNQRRAEQRAAKAAETDSPAAVPDASTPPAAKPGV